MRSGRLPILPPTLLAALLAAAPAAAETLRVGPGERFAVPSAAARAAKPGNRVVIAWRLP